MARAINTTANGHNVYRTNNFDRLCADIRNAQVLSAAEQDSLLRAYATASEEEKTSIKERVTKSNLLFVLSLAKKYTGDADLISTLVSLSAFGMYKAVESFDRSATSVSFPMPCIRFALNSRSTSAANTTSCAGATVPLSGTKTSR